MPKIDINKNGKFWKGKAKDLVTIYNVADFCYPDFPIYKQKIDFNSASIGSPIKLEDYIGMNRGYGEYSKDGLYCIDKIKEDVDKTRGLIAKLINADANDVYFSNTTTSAMERALEAIKINKGDEIITTSDEYGSIEKALKLAADSGGGKIKKVETYGNIADNIRKVLSTKTKLIVTSHITHETCKAFPVEEISDLAGEHNILYFVDAAQSIGQVPVDVKKINPDVLVGCGHKWLRGITTSGILYVAERSGLKPFDYSSPYSMPLEVRKGISKSYEEERLDYDGLGNSIEILHLGTVLKEHKKLGWVNEFDRIKHLGRIARQILDKNPYIDLIVPENPAPGMAPFKFRGMKQLDVVKTLYTLGIRVAHKKNTDILRVSVSPFNTIEEIKTLDEYIKDIAMHK